MNILLINHYAGGPGWGMEFRPYYLAREWVRQGHRVEIVACAHSHVRATNPPMQGQVEQREVVEGIGYTWLAAPAYQGNGVGRLLNIAVFLGRVWARTARFVRDFKPDVVIASSTYPLDTWAARHIARRAGARWIYEVHDLWPLSLIELSGLSPLHPFVMLCGWAERSAYAHADGVVSMLPKVHDHMRERGLDLKRLTIVPNGLALDDWPDEPPALPASLQAQIDEGRREGAAIVAHAGSMGLPNALDTLLDAAAALARNTPSGPGPYGPTQPNQPTQPDPPHLPPRKIRFLLVGDGHERERLMRRVQAEGLTDAVHWHPPISRAQVARLLAQVDVAYIGWQRMPLYRFGIAPNKLMDYMMAGCPVLHSVEAGNDPVAESGCGLSVPPGDPQAVAQGLLRLLSLPPAQRREMGGRGATFVRQHHAYEVLAQRFIDSVTTEHRSSPEP